MRIVTIILAGTAACVIISPAALAQQPLTGTLTQVDRIHGTVAIKQPQSGTTGANTGAAAEEFQARVGLSLDTETRRTTLDSRGGEPTPENAGCRSEGPKHRSQAGPHGPSYLCPLAAHLRATTPTRAAAP
jgi:hypothetical protein